MTNSNSDCSWRMRPGQASGTPGKRHGWRDRRPPPLNLSNRFASRKPLYVVSPAAPSLNESPPRKNIRGAASAEVEYLGPAHDCSPSSVLITIYIEPGTIEHAFDRLHLDRQDVAHVGPKATNSGPQPVSAWSSSSDEDSPGTSTWPVPLFCETMERGHQHPPRNFSPRVRASKLEGDLGFAASRVPGPPVRDSSQESYGCRRVGDPLTMGLYEPGLDGFETAEPTLGSRERREAGLGGLVEAQESRRPEQDLRTGRAKKGQTEGWQGFDLTSWFPGQASWNDRFDWAPYTHEQEALPISPGSVVSVMGKHEVAKAEEHGRTGLEGIETRTKGS